MCIYMWAKTDTFVEEGLHGLCTAHCKSKTVDFNTSIIKYSLSGLDKLHYLPRTFYINYEKSLMSLPVSVTTGKDLIRYCLQSN